MVTVNDKEREQACLSTGLDQNVFRVKTTPPVRHDVYRSNPGMTHRVSRRLSRIEAIVTRKR